MTMSEKEFAERLKLGLEIFVPWRLFELQNHSIEEIRRKAEFMKLDLQPTKDSHFPQWDAFLYGQGKGEFMLLVEQLAILSYCLGGVDAFGLQFESKTKKGESL